MVAVDPDKINLLDIAEWGKTVERKNLVAKQLIIAQLEIKSDHMDDTDGDLAVIAECLEMAKWEETVEWDNEVTNDAGAVMADCMEIAKWDDIVEWDNEVLEPLMPQFEEKTDQLNKEDTNWAVTEELMEIAQWDETVEWDNVVDKKPITQFESDSPKADFATMTEILEIDKWDEIVEWDTVIAEQPITFQSTIKPADVGVLAELLEIAQWDDIVEWDNEVLEPLMPQFEEKTDQLNKEDANWAVTEELMEIAQWDETVEWDNVVDKKPITQLENESDSPKADFATVTEILEIAKWDEIVEWDTVIAEQPITFQSTIKPADVAVLAELLEIAQWDENVEWESNIAVKIPNKDRLEINASQNNSFAEESTNNHAKCYKDNKHLFVDLTSLTNLSLNENDTPDVQNDRMQPLQTIGNVEIYRSDIDSLECKEWLTDAIVDGWINLCAERSKFDHNCSIVFNFGAFFHIFIREDFKRKFSADLIAGAAADLMTFPVCISNHWTLVYADRRTMIITEYDPLQKRQPHRQILKDVKDFLDYIDEIYRPGSAKWIISESATYGFPRQTNYFDCGLFVLKLVECMCNNIYADYNQSQMTAYRFYVKATILSRTIVEVNDEVKEDPIEDFLTKEFLTGEKWDKTFKLNEIETINEVQFIGECRMILDDSPVNQCINISSPIDDKLSLCEISDQLGFGDLMFINNSIEIATQMDTSTQFEYPVELSELTTHNATTEIATFPILKELEKSNKPNLYSTRPVRIRKPPNRFMF